MISTDPKVHAVYNAILSGHILGIDPDDSGTKCSINAPSCSDCPTNDYCGTLTGTTLFDILNIIYTQHPELAI